MFWSHYWLKNKYALRDLLYEIHNFIFGEGNPTFNRIGSLAVKRTSDDYFTSICDDRLVIVDGQVVKVWNFVTDQWAAWLTVISPHKVKNPSSFIRFHYSHLMTLDNCFGKYRRFDWKKVYFVMGYSTSAPKCSGILLRSISIFGYMCATSTQHQL